MVDHAGKAPRLLKGSARRQRRRRRRPLSLRCLHELGLHELRLLHLLLPQVLPHLHLSRRHWPAAEDLWIVLLVVLTAHPSTDRLLMRRALLHLLVLRRNSSPHRLGCRLLM